MSSSVPDAPAHTRADQPSLSNVGDLLSDITTDLSTLMRQEVELAKAELRQSATRAGKGAGMLAGAGVAALMVLIFISVAVWWGLGNGIGRGWSGLVVGIIWLIIAAALALAGRAALQSVTGLPKTADTVKKIPDAVKGNEGGSL